MAEERRQKKSEMKLVDAEKLVCQGKKGNDVMGVDGYEEREIWVRSEREGENKDAKEVFKVKLEREG